MFVVIVFHEIMCVCVFWSIGRGEADRSRAEGLR